MLALATLTLSACDKDKDNDNNITIENKLAGTWSVSEVTVFVDGVEAIKLEDGLGYMFFDACEVKANTFCDGSIKESLSVTGNAFKYQIIENGSKFILDENANLDNTEDQKEYTIEEATSQTLTLSVTEVNNDETEKTVIKLDKVQ